MPEQLQNLLNQARDLWGKLDNTKKITIGAVALVVAIAFASMSAFSSQPAKVPLFTGLSAEQYGQVTEWLEARSYSYSGSGTSSILVEPEQRQQIMTELAQENLIPVGVEAWEIFDFSPWNETTFEKDVKLHLAMKGALEKMLMTLEFVKTAQVELNLPERSAFGNMNQKGSASVVITLIPGLQRVSPQQVLGMKILVSRAIPNVDRENVSIIDAATGRALTEPDELEREEEKLRLVERKKEIEERERQKLWSEIRTELQGTYPEDRITMVRVNLEWGWNEVEERRSLVSPVEMTPEDPNTPYIDREIMPNGTITISRENRHEGFIGNGFTPGGPTGTEQQLPPGYRDLDYQRSEYVNNHEVVNYVYNQSEMEIDHQDWEEGPRSIAVGVDGWWEKLGPKEDGSGYIREYHPPSEEELRTLEELFKTTVLYNGARGDQISVKHLPKDRRAEHLAEDEELQRQLMIRRLLVVSAISLAVFVLIFLLYRAIKKEIARRRRLREEELAAQQQLMREAALRVADEGAAEVELSVDEKARREMLENAINLAKEKPDQVAKLLRTWLAEES